MRSKRKLRFSPLPVEATKKAIRQHFWASLCVSAKKAIRQHLGVLIPRRHFKKGEPSVSLKGEPSKRRAVKSDPSA
jgi:hypothetical protein